MAVWPIVGANYVHGIQIIAFGASITKGTPYIDEEDGDGRRVGGYEPKLEKLLGEAIGRSSAVYNWGKGGENTSQGVKRFDKVLKEKPDADFVLILEGTNDDQQFSVKTTIHHLDKLIDESLKKGIQPILGTLTPDARRGQSPFSPIYIPLLSIIGIL